MIEGIKILGEMSCHIVTSQIHFFFFNEVKSIYCMIDLVGKIISIILLNYYKKNNHNALERSYFSKILRTYLLFND